MDGGGIKGNLTPIYQTALTTDGAYHDLDLSSRVPATATAVVLRVMIKDDEPGTTISIRNNAGYAHKDHSFPLICNAPVSGLYGYASGIVGCDGQSVEYMTTNTTITTIQILVVGYFT